MFSLIRVFASLVVLPFWSSFVFVLCRLQSLKLDNLEKTTQFIREQMWQFGTWSVERRIGLQVLHFHFEFAVVGRPSFGGNYHSKQR